MAQEPASENGSTRWIETSHGILSYSQLAPLLAERVLRVQQSIDRGEYSNRKLDEELICRLHSDFCLDLVPAWAGKWRTIRVRVGTHEPPPPHEVALHMRNYTADLQERLRHTTEVDLLPRCLAFAEGKLLSIHPFADWNGRLTRLWLWELLRRLQVPPVKLAPAESEELAIYLQALRAADQNDFGPLETVWRARVVGSSGLF